MKVDGKFIRIKYDYFIHFLHCCQSVLPKGNSVKKIIKTGRFFSLFSGWCGGSFQHPSPGRRDNGTPGLQCPSGVGDVSASNRYHPNGATPEAFGQSE